LLAERDVTCSVFFSGVYRVNRYVEIVLLLLWPNLSTAVRTFEVSLHPYKLYSSCPLLSCYPARQICFRSIVFSHGVDSPIWNTSTSRPYNPGHQIEAPNRIPGTQLNGSEELVEYGTQYDPLMYRTSLGYLSGNLFLDTWVEVLCRRLYSGACSGDRHCVGQ